MRALYVMSAVFVASALMAAQPPSQGANAQLDAVLTGWEKALTQVRSLDVDCERTIVDRVFQTTERFKGSAKYLKSAGPGQWCKASLELHKMTAQGPSPTAFEKYICTGAQLCEYSPDSKVIRIHDLPQLKATEQNWDRYFPPLLFGMKAGEAKQRYQLSLTPPPDMNYYYLEIHPNLNQDKADFTKAQLVLFRSNFLPRRAWFHQPNGNSVTWDFLQVRPDVPIPPAAFEQPKPPPGWKIE